MPTVRSMIDSHGSFVRALYQLHETPSFNNLMEAYTKADNANRKALKDALRTAGWLKDLDLDVVHQMWLMSTGGEIKVALDQEFEMMDRLDEECDEPWNIPLRRGE